VVGTTKVPTTSKASGKGNSERLASEQPAAAAKGRHTNRVRRASGFHDEPRFKHPPGSGCYF
jgi:hypothetical protein